MRSSSHPFPLQAANIINKLNWKFLHSLRRRFDRDLNAFTKHNIRMDQYCSLNDESKPSLWNYLGFKTSITNVLYKPYNTSIRNFVTGISQDYSRWSEADELNPKYVGTWWAKGHCIHFTNQEKMLRFRNIVSLRKRVYPIPPTLKTSLAPDAAFSFQWGNFVENSEI